MQEVPLTRGLVALVSNRDYKRVMQYKWYAQKPNNTTFYAVRTAWTGDRKRPERVYMHRFILGVTDPKILVDHKDRDGLNNQRNNLRKTNKSGNGVNLKTQSGKLYSKYKGVCYRKDTKKFTSHIHVGGVQRSLGCYLTEMQAARAYDTAALLAWGKFALLNLPEAVC